LRGEADSAEAADVLEGFLPEALLQLGANALQAAPPPRAGRVQLPQRDEDRGEDGDDDGDGDRHAARVFFEQLSEDVWHGGLLPV
jgi:hypothetical protein